MALRKGTITSGWACNCNDQKGFVSLFADKSTDQAEGNGKTYVNEGFLYVAVN